jgi:hypothetical protein
VRNQQVSGAFLCQGKSLHKVLIPQKDQASFLLQGICEDYIIKTYEKGGRKV